MSGAVVEPKEENFTLVAPVRSGTKVSALYKHLKSCAGDKLLKELERNQSIKKIMHKENINAILLALKTPAQHDLYAHFPANFRTKYPRHRLEDRHVRVDKIFGSRAKRWYQWHYTERINLDKGKCATVHAYFNYGSLVDVSVSEGSEAMHIDQALRAAIIENCQDARLLMMQAIAQMKSLKLQLDADFEAHLKRISELDLKTIAPTQVEEYLSKARVSFEKLRPYQDDIIDKRMEQAQNYVRNVLKHQRMPTVAGSTATDSGSSSAKATAAKTKKNKIKVKPAPINLVTADHLKQLNTKYSALHERQGKIANAKEANLFEKELQELKLDIDCAYVNNTDKSLDKRCEILRSVIREEPTLFDLFKRFVYKLNVGAAIELFPEVAATIPANFYTEFLSSLFKNQLTHEQQLKALDLCKFFFEHAQDYRLLLSMFHTLSFEFTANDGSTIGLHLLVQAPLLGYFELFQLILDQCSNVNLTGYVEHGNITPLIDVLCYLSSRDYVSAKYILELLKHNADVRNSLNFASPLSLRKQQVEDSISRLLYNVQRVTIERTEPLPKMDVLTTDDEIVNTYKGALGDSVFAGGPLAAYCEAPYREPEVLQALIKKTPCTLNLIYALGLLSLDECNFAVNYSNKKTGISAEFDKIKLKNFLGVRADTIQTGASFFGICYSHDDAQSFANLKLMVQEAHPRLLSLDALTIARYCQKLGENAAIYLARNQTIRATACHRAVIFLTLYREPSLDGHRILMHQFIHIGDILMQQYRERGLDFFLEQANVQYKQALTWALVSKFRVNLNQDAELQRINALLNPKDESTFKSEFKPKNKLQTS